ncbi:hypothetical protein TrVFT333_005423 [Trichoderma virens FT-333]|nr:hypothetical protein TrVFT333_005423 [Trichoderma virens FT-333]
MNFLLNNGADPNIPNKDGLTAFHLSFDKGLAKSMLDHPKAGNIDLEKMTRAGMAPIHLAVEKSEFGIVQRILNKGVGYKVKTVHGLSCLDLAAGRDTSDILETLLNRDWGIDDIVSAYWSAIRKLKVDNVKLLVTKRESLLDETYDKGLGGLETCLLMRPRREIEQATSLAVYFLEKEGENLFCKRESLNMSIFELCVFSQAKFNAELLQACLKYLPKHSETLGLGYRELRIATEINKDDLDLWDRLKHLRRLITEEKDQDGWNMDQFLYQAEPRQSYDTWDAEAIKCATKMPTALIIPSLWQVNDPDIQASVNISPDGLEATFTGR